MEVEFSHESGLVSNKNYRQGLDWACLLCFVINLAPLTIGSYVEIFKNKTAYIQVL